MKDCAMKDYCPNGSFNITYLDGPAIQRKQFLAPTKKEAIHAFAAAIWPEVIRNRPSGSPGWLYPTNHDMLEQSETTLDNHYCLGRVVTDFLHRPYFEHAFRHFESNGSTAVDLIRVSSDMDHFVTIVWLNGIRTRT